MFFLRNGDEFVPTVLQAEDRIRVRPNIGERGRFCVWRPMRSASISALFPIFRVRRATRLWIILYGTESTQWLDLPRGKGDAFQRIAELVGYENLLIDRLRWTEEEPAFAVDQRFDYVAHARTLV